MVCSLFSHHLPYCKCFQFSAFGLFHQISFNRIHYLVLSAIPHFSSSALECLASWLLTVLYSESPNAITFFVAMMSADINSNFPISLTMMAVMHTKMTLYGPMTLCPDHLYVLALILPHAWMALWLEMDGHGWLPGQLRRHSDAFLSRTNTYCISCAAPSFCPVVAFIMLYVCNRINLSTLQARHSTF